MDLKVTAGPFPIKILILFFELSSVIVLVVGCSGGHEIETPKFMNISCNAINESSDGKLCIEITYPDSNNDTLVASRVYGENAVYEGRLLKEQTTASVVLGDSSRNLGTVEVGSNFLHANYFKLYITSNYLSQIHNSLLYIYSTRS